ncbi:hypothetical protein AVEN_205509-1 [Araneus ventricosus]|uniref:CCHC-type domain-containing protein n=1 Tax=Araneus ventricosus TaxID=182803 RepID=A0A4Y2RX16_ARAVE|nr:hypothetical protein AVEN_205509-1 [Araneus ventricosus]
MPRAGGCLPLLGSVVGGDTTFDTFFVLKRITTTNESFHTVSPFLVEKAITAKLGMTKSTRKLRSGDLLIEIETRKQAQQIFQLKSLDTIPVTVSAHATLNSSKGVISCGELLHVPMEEVFKGFKPQGVTHIQRIKIRQNGQLIDTKHLILTFHSPKIPDSVRAGYIKLKVRPYIPNPLRCYKCQRFGHSKASCRGTLTCARCAEAGHDSSDCKASEKCVNSPGTSYASAVRKKPETTSPRILPTILHSVPFKASYTPSEICPRSIDPVLTLSSTDTRNETATFLFKVPESNKNPPDFSDFKIVTSRKKLKKDSQINQDNITAAKVSQSYKPPQLMDKEHSKASNSVTKQTETANSNSESSGENSSDTDSDLTVTSAPEVSNTQKNRDRSTSEKSQKLKQAKRGLSQKDLPAKLKKSAHHNSVALGLADRGIVHKDLPSIFGGVPQVPDLKLHPSDEDDDLQMNCDASETPPCVPTSNPPTLS